MDRLKSDIETLRKEQAQVKAQHKAVLDAWFKTTAELNKLPANHPELKKKEKDCENQQHLSKQLAETLAQIEHSLQRLSQNLLFFFEENLTDLTGKKSSGSSKTSASAPEPTAAPTTDASSDSEGKKKKKKKEGSSDVIEWDHSSVKAFRRNLLGYCHGSHGVNDNIAEWKEKLPLVIKRAAKHMPAEVVKSFNELATSEMKSVADVRKKLILWYVGMFPNERKPTGYYEAAGITPPAKKPKVPKGEDVVKDEVKVEKGKPTATPKATAASPAPAAKSSSKKKAATPSSSSSSSSDDGSSSSSSEEPPAKKVKVTETPVVSKSSKKDKKEAERKEEEKKSEKKKHHKHEESKSKTVENLSRQSSGGNKKKDK